MAKNYHLIDSDTLTSNTVDVSNNELISFFKDLAEQKASFLVSGEMAAAFYGYIQPTTKIEIWLREGHLERLSTFLNLEEDANGFTSLVEVGSGGSFELSISCNLIHYKARDFDSCYARREQAVLEGVSIPIINLDDLITEKNASGEMEDLKMVAELEKINSY